MAERLLPRAEVERPAQVSSARLRNRRLAGLAAQIERSVPPNGSPPPVDSVAQS